MTYYQNTINEMVSIILEKKLPYGNTIIIGNNSSGKSELLKRLLQKSDFGHWFIDKIKNYPPEKVLRICEKIYINYQLQHIVMN